MKFGKFSNCHVDVAWNESIRIFLLGVDVRKCRKNSHPLKYTCDMLFTIFEEEKL
jgi:hypothetical protein